MNKNKREQEVKKQYYKILGDFGYSHNLETLQQDNNPYLMPVYQHTQTFNHIPLK